MRWLVVVLIGVLIAACDGAASGGLSASDAMEAINRASGADKFEAAGLDPRWSDQVLEVKDLKCQNTGEDLYECDLVVRVPVMTGTTDKPAWGDATETRSYRFAKDGDHWAALRLVGPLIPASAPPAG